MTTNSWNEYFTVYDLFRNNIKSYRKTIEYHSKELSDCNYILDTGAGTGNLTLELLACNKIVDAIDISSQGLNFLERKFKRIIKNCPKKQSAKFKENLHTHVMDATELKFPAQEFCAASSVFVIPFIHDIDKYFSEIYRVLKNKGKFTFSSWSPLEDTWAGVILREEKELTQLGFLPLYQKQWEKFIKKNTDYREDVVKGPDIEKIKKSLEKVGFSELNIFQPSFYGIYSYTGTAIK